MIPQLRLGVQLMRAGGRTRSVLVVAGNLVGAVVLLGAVSIPRAITGSVGGFDFSHRILESLAIAMLAASVVVLLLTVGRLSAGVRDRRLAALRLIGVSPAGTRLAAAVENGVLAALGAVLGVTVFVSLAPAIDGVVARGPAWFVAPLSAGISGIVGVLAVIVATSILSSLAPTRALSVDPMNSRRVGRVRRPSLLRLVPLVLGSAYLVWILQLPPETLARSTSPIYGSLVAMAVVGIGLPLAVPILVRLVGDALVTWGRSSSALLAGRRMQVEPASAARVVAGVTFGVFVVTGACSAIAMNEHTVQYVNAVRVLTVGPQWTEAQVISPSGAQALGAVAGVQGWAPDRWLMTACDSPFSPPDPTSAKPCVRAIVATCAQMQVVMRVSTPDCRDDRVLRIVGGENSDVPLENVALTLYDLSDGVVEPAIGMKHVTVVANGVVHVSAPAEQQVDIGNDILIPPTWPGIEALIDGQDRWVYRLDGGRSVRSAMDDAAARVAPSAYLFHEDIQPAETVQAYRIVMWSVAGVVLAVGLSSMIIGTVDRIMERRAWLAAQVAIGVPLRTLRVAQVVQSLAPLAVGLICAIGVGTLAGAALLALDNGVDFTPWGRIGTVANLCLAAALITALATLPALGRRLDPRFLRRE